MAKILIVEDDVALANNIANLLSFEKHAVDVVYTGQDASLNLKTWSYDAIILDILLPDLTGYEVLKEYRTARGSSPVLILTGRTTIFDKTTGFDAGCDDYLTKPFHMKELSARINALLRRPKQLTPVVLSAGDISLNTSNHRVEKAGVVISLPPIEYQFLEFLMRHPDQSFSSDTLFKRIWPSDSTATNEAIKAVIKRLRKKLDPDGNMLQTIHGSGYILRTSGEPGEKDDEVENS